MPANSRSAITPGSSNFFQGDPNATLAELRAAERSVTRDPAEAEQVYSARVDAVRGQALGLARHATELTESFGHRVQNALSSVERAIIDGVHGGQSELGGAASATGTALASLRSTAQDAASRAGGALTQGGIATGRAGGNVVAALVYSPVLLGALGVAAGALLGVLLPQSDQEEQALGAVAGQVRETARNLANEGLQRGSQVADAVLNQSHDNIAAHDFTGKSAGNLVDAALSGDPAENAAQVAQDVLRAGDKAVRTGLEPESAAAPVSAISSPS
jgi:hypothetical protein